MTGAVARFSAEYDVDEASFRDEILMEEAR